MSPDYQSMQVGDRALMPVANTWEGQNQDLFREIQDYCLTQADLPQFEVETIREPGKQVEFWLQRIR